MIEHALAQALAYLPTILLAALVFLAGIGLAPLTRRLVERRLQTLP